MRTERASVRWRAKKGPPASSEGGYHAYFHIDGVNAFAKELQARGAAILDGPEDRIYHQRELVVLDCNGFVLAFGEDTSGRAT